jgi:hypothetical protein
MLYFSKQSLRKPNGWVSNSQNDHNDTNDTGFSTSYKAIRWRNIYTYLHKFNVAPNMQVILNNDQMYHIYSNTAKYTAECGKNKNHTGSVEIILPWNL